MASQKTEYPIHPLCAIYPYITGKDKQKLEDSIRYRGLDLPVKLWRDMIVDGKNRRDACEAVNKECRFENVSHIDEEDLPDYVAIWNERRRHMTKEEKKACQLTREKLAERARAEGKSIRQIADELGVSAKQIQKDLKKSEKNKSTPQGEKPKEDTAKEAPGVDRSTPDKKTTESNGVTGDTRGVEENKRNSEKTSGMDGKKYPAKKEILCKRCKRVGAIKGCSACEKLRNSRKRQENGQPAFDFKWAEKTIGEWVKRIDNWAKIYGKKSEPYINACKALDLLLASSNQMKAWKGERVKS